MRTLVVLPARWTYAHVLTPLGHGLVAAARGVGAAVAWLVRYLVVVPAVALWTGFVWLLRMLFVVPAQFVYRYLLTPLGRALAVVAREIGTRSSSPGPSPGACPVPSSASWGGC